MISATMSDIMEKSPCLSQGLKGDLEFWIFVLNLLLSYSCWWCFNLIGQPTCFGDASLVASLSCSFCSLFDYRRVVTVSGRENIMNLVHTFDHAYVEHINVLCTWCSITYYPRVVTSTREGKGWTPCSFTFDRLDRVLLARWLHLQVILDPFGQAFYVLEISFSSLSTLSSLT
jgi:hypothetical protein